MVVELNGLNGLNGFNGVVGGGGLPTLASATPEIYHLEDDENRQSENYEMLDEYKCAIAITETNYLLNGLPAMVWYGSACCGLAWLCVRTHAIIP